ncbi:MAG: type II toxin-antitoxin system VapC family toxin [Candidatus Binatia bacterium]
MILDSSAIAAIVFKEPGFESLLDRMRAARQLAIGAPTLTETGIVLSARLERDARGLTARLVQEAMVMVVPFGEAHYATAVDAWLRFGRGRHPAALNFGDCMSYAVSRLAAQPLLCVGDDFRLTDLLLA